MNKKVLKVIVISLYKCI